MRPTILLNNNLLLKEAGPFAFEHFRMFSSCQANLVVLFTSKTIRQCIYVAPSASCSSVCAAGEEVREILKSRHPSIPRTIPV